MDFLNKMGHACCVLGLLCAPNALWACASCGCTLNADAALGYSPEPGWRFGFEYDYIHQDQLRNGRHAAATVPDDTELERETLNRYLTVGVDYAPSENWNIDLRVPYIIRTHSTYGDYQSGEELPPTSNSRSSSLGDVRLIGSYQGFLAMHNFGVQLGVKLPTGQYGTDVKFKSGPAAGEPLDASLQPGTGSTDIIVGAYFYQPVGTDFNVFATLQFQSAVISKQSQPGSDFRPGNSTTGTLGIRYVHDPRVMPQLQLNLLHKSVDQGALADITSTAGEVAYLSPGVTVKVAERLNAYLFGQLPVYSNLVGYQLFPRYTVSVGASYAL